MSNALLAGMVLAIAAAATGETVEHRTRVDHHSGAVDTLYRGDVRIIHKQVGSVSAPGRPSSLSCTWRADIAVTRDARHPSGSSFSRAVERQGVMEGRRPGWCSTSRNAIAREVAKRTNELRDHVVQVAREDHPMLQADIDRAYAKPRVG